MDDEEHIINFNKIFRDRMILSNENLKMLQTLIPRKVQTKWTAEWDLSGVQNFIIQTWDARKEEDR